MVELGDCFREFATPDVLEAEQIVYGLYQQIQAERQTQERWKTLGKIATATLERIGQSMGYGLYPKRSR